MVINQNLREQVLWQVRAEIISGQSMPGSMYSVSTLAASLGVSSTPVREALYELTRSGLIEPMRNRGFKVVKQRLLKELRNISTFVRFWNFRLRRSSHASLKRIWELIGLADDIARAVKTEDIMLYIEADRSFHRQLTAAAENERLTEMVMGLRDQMRLYGIKSRHTELKRQKSTAEHYKIIELATAGNVEALNSS